MLANKVILVTGGGTGIGAATAKQAVRDGASVVVMGRRKDAVEAVAEAIGSRAVAVAGDAGLAADVGAAVALAHRHFGHLDAVVACAGAVDVGAVGDIDDEHWHRMLYANLDTVRVTARESLPSLIERRGSFVVVASIAGLNSMPSSAGYVTAKHAAIGLMRSMTMDYSPQGVRVNAVCPGWVRTPMADVEMQAIMKRDGVSVDEAYGLVTSDVPLRRAADPLEVAHLCCFLASDRASIVSGAVITADGGSTVPSVPTLKM